MNMKTEQVLIRMTKKEKQRLRIQAEAKGLKMGQYINLLIQAHEKLNINL